MRPSGAIRRRRHSHIPSTAFPQDYSQCIHRAIKKRTNPDNCGPQTYLSRLAGGRHFCQLDILGAEHTVNLWFAP